MGKDEHGSCVHCGYDLNGDYIWEYFRSVYQDDDIADKVAGYYGATREHRRFGKAIYVKPYDENYNKLPSYYKCPECGEKCYETNI